LNHNFACFIVLAYMQFGPLEGVVFADYGSDLGSGPKVPGKLDLLILFLSGICLYFVPRSLI
jgi:hypothetical protein